MLTTFKKFISAVANSHLIKDEGGWIQFALPLAGAIGSYFSNKAGKKQKQTSTQTTTSANTATSAPTVTPEYSPLQKMLIDRATASLQRPAALPRGYEEQGIRGINRTYDLAEQSLGNNLTARGLGGSPIAGAAEGRLSGGRASDIVQFQGTLPLLERQMQQEDLASAMNMLNFGIGRSTTGSNTGSGTTAGNMQYNEGSPFGAGISTLAQLLGFFYGQGAFGGSGGAKPGNLGQGYFGPGY